MAEEPFLKELNKAIRSPERPILVPRHGEKIFWWEAKGTFNPGVAEYKNQVVLLYRAYDQFRISRLGLAHGQNGIDFRRYQHPAIDTNPDDPYERLGIEDPRITRIDSTYYIVHSSASYHTIGQAADVSGMMEHIPWRVRIGMHSTTDFRTYEHWGVLLPNEAAKNGCLLPSKFDGRYGMYYRQHTAARGEIFKIAFTKDFESWEDIQEIVVPSMNKWQTIKFGIGSQPISTPRGFLMIYHIVDQQQVYRLGLMLLDRGDPSKIVWYSNPILEPEALYEKDGYVSNVVYSCGALLRDSELWIYYGAADYAVGRAILDVSSIVG